MGLLEGPGPRWFTIAPHRPFLLDLADALIVELSREGPEALAEAVVLLPTRRAARGLEEAFLAAAGGRALLLPEILALGDLEEGEPPFEPGDMALDLPQAISSSRRRFELAALVRARPALFAGALGPEEALAHADALAAFLDSAALEEIDPGPRLGGLVTEDLAAHWARSADVLDIAVTAWPARLRELGLADVAERRTRLLRALAARWSQEPPHRVLIAAGSTGSAPATAALLRVIAAAPRGAVVLPGLDRDLDEAAWGEVGEAHPQGAMKRLLAGAKTPRSLVRPWPAIETEEAARRGAARRRIVNEALRPPDATADWLDVIAALRDAGGSSDLFAEGLEGLSAIPARNEEHAAELIALLLREALETPGRTAALVTPDAALGRRVAARLARFGLAPDASVGPPLALAPHGALIGILAGLFEDPLAPSLLLALAKHPLARFALPGGRRARAAAALERPRPLSFDALAARLEAALARRSADGEGGEAALTPLRDALALVAGLRAAVEGPLAPFAAGPLDFAAAATGLCRTLEAACAPAPPEPGRLWTGADGEAAAALLAETIDDSRTFGPVGPGAFARILGALMAARPLPRSGGDQRVRILGALEGRLLGADLLVLAGLEEGVWPRAAPVDPFLSRPMRQSLGLPAPERRIGLSAHDFAQAACAPKVALIVTERRDGQPAVKSRWLWRLETVLRGAGLALEGRGELRAWCAALDAPLAAPPRRLAPAERPRPAPPREARPRRLAVTRIETWVRDPYAVYARDILRLRPLDRPDAALEAAQRGTAMHRAFQRFAEAAARDPAAADAAAFEALALNALKESGVSLTALARERPLARRLGGFAAAFERDRRARADQVLVEQEGELAVLVDGSPFVVTAKADRVETVGGRADVIDFKTGAPPSRRQVAAGFSPQLTLTAAILAGGGFAAIGPAAPGALLYVRVNGRDPPGSVSLACEETESADLADAAVEGLRRLVRRFDDPSVPYLPWTAPQFLATRAGDYDHLSRLYEWHVLGEAEAEPEP
jgi:ATP-dependent helicase/nuclease subunit B